MGDDYSNISPPLLEGRKAARLGSGKGGAVTTDEGLNVVQKAPDENIPLEDGELDRLDEKNSRINSK